MYEQALDWMRRNTEKHGAAADLMRRAKAGKPSWYKLLQGKDVRASSFLRWLDNLGFKLVAPGGEVMGNGREAGFTCLDAADIAAQKRRVAELEGKLALLQDLYDKVLDELTDLKAETMQFRKTRSRNAPIDRKPATHKPTVADPPGSVL